VPAGDFGSVVVFYLPLQIYGLKNEGDTLSYDFDIPDRRSAKPDDYRRKDRRGQMKRSWSIGVSRQHDQRQCISFDDGLTWGSIGQILGYLLGETDEAYQNALSERMIKVYYQTDRGSILREPGVVKVILRVATWNLQYSAEERSLRLLNYLKSNDWDLVALQEVSRKAWKVFQEDGIADGGYFTLDGFGVEPSGHRHHGVAILARNGLSLYQPTLLDGLPKAERALSVKVKGLESPLTLVAWHAPNYAGEGLAVKMQAYRAISKYISTLEGPLILGFDGNHENLLTSIDPPDSTNPESQWYPENGFFSNDSPHNLTDSLLDYLRKEDDVYRSILAERPDGPLAVTYIHGTQEDRFDYIFISPEFEVLACDSDYFGARAASSDHAFVTTDLQLKVESTSE
jgi:exonuclease III